MRRIQEGRTIMPYQENASIFTRDVLMGAIKPCLSTKILGLDLGTMIKMGTVMVSLTP